MIYVMAHKPFEEISRPGYRVLEVGAACRTDQEHFGDVRDDEGETISIKNPSYCELTGLYWIWKNTADPVKGLVHYRRYFGRHRRTNDPGEIISFHELTGFLSGRYDIILPKKTYYAEPAREQLLQCCSEKTLALLDDIMEKMAPSYMGAYRRFMNGGACTQYNMLAAGREIFDDYCTFLFPILSEMEKRIDLSEMNDYERRVFGFIGERLLDVWVLKHHLSVKYLPTVETELSGAKIRELERHRLTHRIRFVTGIKR